MKKLLLLLIIAVSCVCRTDACSILYYVDSTTGKIYVANNEDYFFNVKPYIRIEPADKGSYARLWYGWDDFAQGGINQWGLFFDGATTPEEPALTGYHKPKGNLGDNILATCKTVGEALAYLEREKVALTKGHLMFGDKAGNAVVVEWVNGKRNCVYITDNRLIATNFLLTDSLKGGYPCPRYSAMEHEIELLRQSHDSIGLKQIGNIAARAVQQRATDEKGQELGTLYSTFINITDMDFALVYKLDNRHLLKLNLSNEFANAKRRTIKLR